MNATSTLHFGVAYYDEYMPYERLQEDVRLMREAGINVVRIAESTWSTHEPQPGLFDFRSIDRVLEAMYAAGIGIIVGTPTYAIPAWLARLYPDVMVTTRSGRQPYGARQIMDITHAGYLFHAERIIRQLIGHVRDHPAVIGYQLDNETKHYGTASANVQQRFVRYLKSRFGTTAALNSAWGLDYWSNRIDAWEDVPASVGTINASFASAFAAFQRTLVDEFLAWQADIVRELRQPNQFLTHNFDFEWRGYSFGVQPDVDHNTAARVFDVVGIDVYHPTQEQLTGAEIAFAGDIARSLAADPTQTNYLVLETQAQGLVPWLPFPGQLRLQAYANLASGARMVAYWHWHSLHNSCETYWRGLLAHDFQPNPTYQEACTIGREFARLAPHVGGLQPAHRAAVLVSNTALTAMSQFKINGVEYNDVFRLLYDALYRLNIGTDIVWPDTPDLSRYDLLIVPSLYSAEDMLLDRLSNYVRSGGHAVFTFRTGFMDEHMKVRTDRQPGRLADVCGMSYSQYTNPTGFGLAGDPLSAGDDNRVLGWIELLQPAGAEVVARYEHPVWGSYAAITRNRLAGGGTATYVGTMLTPAAMKTLMADEVRLAGLWGPDQDQPFPISIRGGVTAGGRRVRYYMNFSAEPRQVTYHHRPAHDLLAGNPVDRGALMQLDPWGVAVVQEMGEVGNAG